MSVLPGCSTAPSRAPIDRTASVVRALRLRRLRALAGSIVTGLAITACGARAPSAAAPAPFDVVGIQGAIDSLGARVMRAHETGDATLFASTWARDGIMSAAGQPPLHGREAIVAAFRQRPPLPPGARMTIHPVEMRVLSPEWAYVMGVDTLRHAAQGGVAPPPTTFTFLVLLRKTAEGWQSYREVLTRH